MTKTDDITEMSVWYPKGKSAGSFMVISYVEGDKVRAVRHDPGKDPHSVDIRTKTLLARYEKEGHALIEEKA